MKVEKNDLKNALIASAIIEGSRRLIVSQGKTENLDNYYNALLEIDESILENFDKIMYQLATGPIEDQHLHNDFIVFIALSKDPCSIIKQAEQCESADALKMKIIARGWNKAINLSIGEKIIRSLKKIREAAEPTDEELEKLEKELEEEKRKYQEAKDDYYKHREERRLRRKKRKEERKKNRK